MRHGHGALACQASRVRVTLETHGSSWRRASFASRTENAQPSLRRLLLWTRRDTAGTSRDEDDDDDESGAAAAAADIMQQTKQNI